jgi:DNA-binding transcriptional regulator YhcF (GntR family)
MSGSNFLTITEQVAVYLRGEIMQARWIGTIPGMNHLAPELEVNAKTVEAALRLLEAEGILVSQGAGRPRRIELPHGKKARATMKIAILDYDVNSRQVDYMIKLQHGLAKAGHQAFFPAQSLTELGMDVSRIRRVVKSVNADAWVVCAA